ncbi:MAG: Hpt domain-containing protein [Desulfobacterales bacterium]|nr:Hpt domain-containing protein [Desulfobacterales bacterium]
MQNTEIKELADRLNLEPEEFRELLALFVSSTREEIGQLREALSENNLERASQLVHSFKGAAVNLGLNEIAAHGEKLQAAIKNLEDIDIESLIEKVLYEIERLAGYL